MLALVQTFYHLYYDYDRIALTVQYVKQDSTHSRNPHHVIQPLVALRAKSFLTLRSVVLRSIVISVIGPVLYALFIRQMAWNSTMLFAQLLWNLSKASGPSVAQLYSWSLLQRSASSGFLLMGLWELSNAVFGAYVAQEPLKCGVPLTDDSRDPNGSLLNGLKSKKETIKVMTSTEFELIFTNQLADFCLLGTCLH